MTGAPHTYKPLTGALLNDPRTAISPIETRCRRLLPAAADRLHKQHSTLAFSSPPNLKTDTPLPRRIQPRHHKNCSSWPGVFNISAEPALAVTTTQKSRIWGYHDVRKSIWSLSSSRLENAYIFCALAGAQTRKRKNWTVYTSILSRSRVASSRSIPLSTAYISDRSTR